MGRGFFEQSKAARETFTSADEVLGLSLSKVCFEGPEEKLAETDLCQPAILTCSVAIVRALRERGVLDGTAFDAAAGLSLGEYSALWFAGALSFEDALRLVRIRGQAMQQASELSPSGMISLLGAGPEVAQKLCERYAEGDVLVCGNFLAPKNTAVAGSVAALDRIEQHAAEEGVRRAVRLKVAGAFHSPLMQQAQAALREALSTVEIQSPKIPVLANVSAQPHAGGEQIREDLVRQVTSSVRWDESMQALLARGIQEFLEPGPGTVLSGLLRQIDKKVQRQSVDQIEELEAMAAQGGVQ
jgi:[acyl-carrier-protein] S-malonyltransferase